jgi:hypothetical protein
MVKLPVPANQLFRPRKCKNITHKKEGAKWNLDLDGVDLINAVLNFHPYLLFKEFPKRDSFVAPITKQQYDKFSARHKKRRRAFTLACENNPLHTPSVLSKQPPTPMHTKYLYSKERYRDQTYGKVAFLPEKSISRMKSRSKSCALQLGQWKVEELAALPYIFGKEKPTRTKNDNTNQKRFISQHCRVRAWCDKNPIAYEKLKKDSEDLSKFGRKNELYAPQKKESILEEG